MKRSVASRISKKQLIFTAAATILLLLCYIAWSIWQWQQYSTSAATKFSQAMTTAKAATAPRQQQASANVKGLRSVSSELDGVGQICEPHWTVGWQTILPSVGKEVEDCQNTAKNYQEVQRQVDTVVAFLDSEQEVLGVLAPLQNTKKLTDKTWDETIDIWLKANSDLEAAQPSQNYQPVVKELQKQVEKTINAWKQLKKADKNEKRSAYESAYDSLDQAITGMIDSADTSDEILASLLEDLQRSVESL